jgi:hypothetical protein
LEAFKRINGKHNNQFGRFLEKPKGQITEMTGMTNKIEL